MSEKRRFALALAAACGFVLAAAAGGALLVAADLADTQRAALADIVASRAPNIVVAAALVLAAIAIALRELWRRYVVAPEQLAQDARIMLVANHAHRAPQRGSAEIAALAGIFNDFADAHAALARDVDGKVRDANARIAQERNRLAALMSELAQSVVVCNYEGRILLYNARAMQLLRKPLAGAAGGKAHSLVGLGRSVFAIFDRNLIIHALDSVHERGRQGVRNPVATFVTSAPAGQLVRVQLAPVAGAASEGAEGGAAGFVLLLDDITRRIESGHRRDRLLQSLTQGTRASLANMRAAVETVVSFPDMDKPARDRFIGIVGEEARSLSTQLDRTATEFADALRTEWPLEEMRGADLIAAARRRIEAKLGLPTKLEEVDESLWLNVDSYSLMQGITYLAARLRDEFAVREVRFALAPALALAHLDLIWTGAPLGFETTMSWQTDAMEQGGEPCPLTLGEIVERHGAEIWYQIDKPAQREYFRIAIPITRPDEAPWSAMPTADSRPEFYDFDLFHQAGQTAELDNQSLAALSYTVFDTETTGLDPSGGDEIVSIGAVRIVNGRLLDHEVFEQLVDPLRPMSAEATAVTGIESAMLQGQPTLDRVLPAFGAFCAETVLVAHNAAFDLRFLHMKEQATGVRFSQPVLDTLLLSAVLHADLATHALEDIAERMGVNPMGRHTAVGDAIMTAEVFLRMLPLLAEKGIHTLGEARAASQKTWLARLTY
ncbi:MAG TPA: exonuclease domain-containing protein [Casimicrobiaceae bacterium]|nr:exonuclease domain-containing protein [Casimicrobiaceae bacterium]